MYSINPRKNNDVAIEKSFTMANGTVYNIDEILACFQKEHYFFDFKNKKLFSDKDIRCLIHDFPELRTACEAYYSDSKLPGLLVQVKNRDELFNEMMILHNILGELIQQFHGWGWIPDEVLAVKLSAPLNKLYKLIDEPGSKFLDFIISSDHALNLFFRGGFNSYLGSIRNGQCSSGFPGNFTGLLVQAQSVKGYLDYTLQTYKQNNSTLSWFSPKQESLPNQESPPDQEIVPIAPQF